MLLEHILDFFERRRGIERRAAQRQEVVECRDKAPVPASLGLDNLRQTRGQLWYLFLEGGDGAVELLDQWLGILKELVQHALEVGRLCYVEVEHLGPILEQHSPLGVLKDDVLGGIPGGDLLADLRVQIVCHVLGLPQPAADLELIAHLGVHSDRAPGWQLDRLLANDGEAAPFADLREQILEGDAGV